MSDPSRTISGFESNPASVLGINAISYLEDNFEVPCGSLLMRNSYLRLLEQNNVEKLSYNKVENKYYFNNIEIFASSLLSKDTVYVLGKKKYLGVESVFGVDIYNEMSDPRSQKQGYHCDRQVGFHIKGSAFIKFII